MGRGDDEPGAPLMGFFPFVPVIAAPGEGHGVKGGKDDDGEEGHGDFGRQGFDAERDGTAEKNKGDGVKNDAEAAAQGFLIYLGTIVGAQAGKTRKPLPKQKLELQNKGYNSGKNTEQSTRNDQYHGYFYTRTGRARQCEQTELDRGSTPRENGSAMADRSWTTDALILTLTAWGESNREALFLTPDKGLQRASVFGGAKSKLRAQVGPWQTGKLWLYTDPVKKSTKITDIDVTAWRQGIRESLVRTWCASLCAEVVSRSHGNADWRVVNAFLDGIAVSDDDECRRGLLRFIWRHLIGAGVNPETGRCARCGEEIRKGLMPGTAEAEAGASGTSVSVAARIVRAPGRQGCKAADMQGFAAEPGSFAAFHAPAKPNSLSASLAPVAYFSPHEDAFLCPQCARIEEQGFALSAPALVYMDAVEHLSPALVRALPLDAPAYAELRSMLFFLLTRLVQGPLKTLESGEGIL